MFRNVIGNGCKSSSRDKFSAGLELGAERDEIYGGFWGYNSLLTGAALGGNLLVLNSHTAIATMLAIVYTVLLQFSIKAMFIKVIGVSCFSSGYFYYALANLRRLYSRRGYRY
jgi:urea transporter